MTEQLPRYDELPVVEGLGLRHAWGVFGTEDELGTINLLTPERVLEAVALVRRGETINLTLPLTAFDPPFYGREPLRHEIFRIDRNYWDDKLDNFLLQSSTHWDGLRHMQAREFGFWNGRKDDSQIVAGSGPIGIEHWAQHGIVGRGVLIDIARLLEESDADYDPFVSRSLNPSDLDAAVDRQGLELRTGDILCIRTGWMSKYQQLPLAGRRDAATAHDFVGLGADEGMARWLWDHHLAAITCDNPAGEVSPGSREVGSLHRRILPLLGFAIGELFDLEALTNASMADGRWDFLFVSVPLNVVGGVGSPANAVAIR
jgi:kynurenine formamidase